MTDAEHGAALDGRLLLVVGARRSGTHWLQRVLAAHPDVVDVPSETYLFSRGIAPLLDRFQHASRGSPAVGKVHARRDVVLGHVRALCDDVLGQYLHGTGARYVLERTPEHVRALPLVWELFPATRVVHIIRDGREVVRSLLEQGWGPTDAGEAALEWRDSVRAGRAAGTGSPHYLEVRHESLGSDPKATLQGVLADLGLGADRATLAGMLAEAEIVSNTARPRPGGGRLRRRQRRAVRRAAGELLADLGYTGGGRRAPDTGPRPEQRASSAMARSGQHIQSAVDRALEVLQGARPVDELVPLVASQVRFELAGPHRDECVLWGPSRAHDFVAAVHEDPALTWSQEASTVHAAGTQVTVVTSFRGPGGDHADRVIVVRVGGDGIEALTVHQLHRAGPVPPEG